MDNNQENNSNNNAQPYYVNPTPPPNPGVGYQYAPGYAQAGQVGQAGPAGYSRPPYIPKKKMSGVKKAILITSIIVAAILVVVLFFVAVSSAFSGNKKDTNKFVSPGNDYIAQISVVGEISSAEDVYSSSDVSYHHKWTLDTLKGLIDDKNNKALILYVDTPGGGVYESDELYLKIKEYKDKTSRPVYVYMGSMAASGGYYISAPADAIYANRNTWTGSIGVIIGTLFEVSKFLDKLGIEATDITSGVNKGMGSEFEPMTDEQREIFQGLVDEAYNQFVGIVSEGRDMDESAVRAIADGRIYTAKQAVDNGLIDGILTRDEFNKKVKELVGNEKYKIEKFDYDNQYSLFGGLIEAANGTTSTDEAIKNGDLAAVLDLLKQNEGNPLKYMVPIGLQK
jgi:protease-4